MDKTQKAPFPLFLRPQPFHSTKKKTPFLQRPFAFLSLIAVEDKIRDKIILTSNFLCCYFRFWVWCCVQVLLGLCCVCFFSSLTLCHRLGPKCVLLLCDNVCIFAKRIIITYFYNVYSHCSRCQKLFAQCVFCHDLSQSIVYHKYGADLSYASLVLSQRNGRIRKSAIR